VDFPEEVIVGKSIGRGLRGGGTEVTSFMSQVRAVEILTLVPPGVIKMEKALRGL
jgi:hypothetical protein